METRKLWLLRTSLLGRTGLGVAGMKKAFFAIFDSTWAHILAPKRPKYGIPQAEFEFSVP